MLSRPENLFIISVHGDSFCLSFGASYEYSWILYCLVYVRLFPSGSWKILVRMKNAVPVFDSILEWFILVFFGSFTDKTDLLGIYIEYK